MTSTTVLNLNLQRPNYSVAMHAVQYDKMSRKITARLYDGDTPFTPSNSADGVVRCHKADGTVCFYDVLEDESTPAVTWSGNVATIWLAEQALTCAGNMLCQVQFYTGTERLTTFTFIVDVQQSAVTDADIVSTDYYSVLTVQIAAIMDVVENMPAPATTLPLMDGVATIGTRGEFARSDHVHPTDTTRASAATTTITVPTTSYDTTKISSVTVKQSGKVVSGKIIIKASALATGYNSITFSIPNISWATTPTSSVWTDGSGDVSKNFYSQIGSSLYIMASESNGSTITVFFTGIAQ